MSVKMNVIRKLLKLKKDSDIKKNNKKEVVSTYDILKLSFDSRDTFKVIKDIALKEMVVKQTTIAGVDCLDVKPNFKLKYFAGTPKNPYHLFFYVHGGGFVGGFKEQGAYQLKAMARRLGCSAISVGYSLSPEATYPTALNELVDVYKEVIKTYNPNKIILGGESAGGNLCLALMLKLKELGLPQPKVAVISAGFLDLTNSGESRAQNENTDYTLSAEQLKHMALLYVAGNNEATKEHFELLKTPLVSPVFGNYEGLPPMFFSVCTDELLYSDTLMAYNNCLRDNIETDLHLAQNCFHAHLNLGDFFEESKVACNQMAKFVAKVLNLNNVRLIAERKVKKINHKQNNKM